MTTAVVEQAAPEVIEEFVIEPIKELHSPRTATALRLGLMNQSHATQAMMSFFDAGQAARTAERAAEHYPEWSGLKLRAWSEFFPTHYPEARWSQYDFDVIPLRALKAIEAAKSAELFDHMEIWTPESDFVPIRAHIKRRLLGAARGTGRAALTTGRGLKRGTASFIEAIRDIEWDPVAVGVVEGRYFPIVRWGADELIPERTIMRVGLRRSLNPRR